MRAKNSKELVAVVGGGLAGLECALGLAKNGHSVEIFEVGNQTRKRHVDWDLSEYPGDEKTRSWSCDGWGKGSGLPSRLGGRSFCYHGVFLEPSALHDSWGGDWKHRLEGEKGLFNTVKNQLSDRYTELNCHSNDFLTRSHKLSHVPQAARFVKGVGFEAYSPLHYLEDYIKTNQVKVTRARVSSLRCRTDSVSIHMVLPNGDLAVSSEFNRVILAASSICNVQILAASIGQDIVTRITDHFCVGAFVKFRGGKNLIPFRHKKLWSGYWRLPHLSSNIFVAEKQPLPNGDRIIELSAIVEQAGNSDNYSTLSVTKLGAEEWGTHIHGNILLSDLERLRMVRAEISSLAEDIAEQKIAKLESSFCGSGSASGIKAPDTRFNDYDEAFRSAKQHPKSGVLSEFELPFGSFEHEACTHPLNDKCGNLTIGRDLAVENLSGVYVVGPGAFPRLSEANPALTIVAMSRWLADSFEY